MILGWMIFEHDKSYLNLEIWICKISMVLTQSALRGMILFNKYVCRYYEVYLFVEIKILYNIDWLLRFKYEIIRWY